MSTPDSSVPQQSILPESDLREMLRRHIIGRSLACMQRAEVRRDRAFGSPSAFAGYAAEIRSAVAGFYGEMPAGAGRPLPRVRSVSSSDHDGFRIENVLFESYPGWEVNATVYVPTDYEAPHRAVVVPVGHSGKQFSNYQLPCQCFARSGFLAVCFDPPGQSSEKQAGNDHFEDGVRDYLLGATSSRYFVADAIRCIDYLATRRDVDAASGVAMTGVSGGGTTTTFAALLDGRIRAIGPCCCLAPLADLDIRQCYAGCPETHMFRRYELGIDEVDLLCAAAPLPCLLMAGAKDEVFRIEDTRRLATTVSRAYDTAAAPQHFLFRTGNGGHEYSLAQAREFVAFMRKWLGCPSPRGGVERVWGDEAFALLPYEQLRCRPRTDVTMRTLAEAEADRLAVNRNQSPDAVRARAARIAGCSDRVSAPAAAEGPPFRVWTHDWRSLCLRPEPGIEMPATLLSVRSGHPAPALLHVDDDGRHRLLYRHGLLARAVNFLSRDGRTANLLTIDLRGWGDTTPAVHPYEIASWGGVDRYAAYATAALGDPLLSMRIRDALAALAWLRERPEVDGGGIVLSGCGLAGVVAAHAAAIAGGLAGLVIWDSLVSFRSLIGAEKVSWPAEAFLPGALNCYDLPELTAAAGCPVRLLGLRSGDGAAATAEELAAYGAQAQTVVHSNSLEDRLVTCLRDFLMTN